MKTEETRIKKYWIIKIRKPNIVFPNWFIPTIQIIIFMLFVGLASGIIDGI